MSSNSDQQRRSAKWDIRSGPRNYLTLVVAQAIGSLTALITAWVLTHLLGVAGYGQFAALIAAAVFLGAAGLSWTTMALARIGCEEFVATGHVTQTFWARSLILILNGLLLVVLAPLWVPLMTTWLQVPREASLLLCLYLGVTAFWGHIQAALQAAKLAYVQAKLLAVERLLILATIGILLIAGRHSLASTIWAFSVAAAGAATLGIWRLRQIIAWRPVIELTQLRRVLLFSLPMFPQALVSYFSTNYLDAWFILHFLSAVELGIYTIAYQLVGAIMQLPVLVSSLLLPLFTTLEVSGEREKIEVYSCEILPVLSWMWAVTCALLIPLIGWLIPLVFGEGFQATAQLIWPLMAACAVAGPVSMGYGPLLNAKAATKAIAIGVLAGSSTNVLLNFLLIPRWGIVGCAWATAGAYLVTLVVSVALFRRVSRIAGDRALEAGLPLLLGGMLVETTGNLWAALLLTLLLILVMIGFRRATLKRGAQRLGQILLRRPAETLLA